VRFGMKSGVHPLLYILLTQLYESVSSVQPIFWSNTDTHRQKDRHTQTERQNL